MDGKAGDDEPPTWPDRKHSGLGEDPRMRESEDLGRGALDFTILTAAQTREMIRVE